MKSRLAKNCVIAATKLSGKVFNIRCSKAGGCCGDVRYTLSILNKTGSRFGVSGSEIRGSGLGIRDLIAVSFCDEYSIGPSTRRICTRCGFTMTNMIQVCSSLHSARVFIINVRPDGIRDLGFGLRELGCRFQVPGFGLSDQRQEYGGSNIRHTTRT